MSEPQHIAMDDRRTAFTLVELLAVIAIMAIIVLAALPALKSIQSTALQTAARQIANELQLTRQYAITQRASVRFCIAVDNSSGDSNRVCRAYTACVGTDTNSDGVVDYWQPLQDWRFLPDGIVFSDHWAG